MSAGPLLVKNTSVVLLRARRFFGANIVNLPAIYFVKKYLNSAHLTLFSDNNLRAFYAQIPWVDLHYETQSFVKTWQRIPKNTSLLYCMRPSMDSAPLFKWFNGIPTTIGLDLRSGFLNSLFDVHVPCHLTQYRAIAHLAPLLAYSQAPLEPHYYLREALLDLAEPTSPENSVCLMPGAGGGEHKKWGIHQFFTCAQQLQKTYPSLHFHFVLGQNEAKEKAFLLQQPSAALNFSIQENLSLSALITLVENSLLTIANDCGPSHVSQCLTKPFIGLYKESNPEWFHAHSQSQSLSPTNGPVSSISHHHVMNASLRLLQQQKTRLTHQAGFRLA
ncbi:MAG TPA: hypothetical protein K8U84_10070 [Paenalcaligenes hominis]|uniref:Heptosyltransferase n=1 Tax=Paenalcaligenes hominis TaxID=643674 RepID=A0A9D2VHM6_9BURK|nr:hypothetical protein [Paenalcaligenes hominis]